MGLLKKWSEYIVSLFSTKGDDIVENENSITNYEFYEDLDEQDSTDEYPAIFGMSDGRVFKKARFKVKDMEPPMYIVGYYVASPIKYIKQEITDNANELTTKAYVSLSNAKTMLMYENKRPKGE